MAGMAGMNHGAPPAPAAQTPGGTNWAGLLNAMGGLNWLLDAPMPEARLAKVEDLKPKYRPTAKRKVFRYGPYTLVGKGVCWIEET
jgi:hypothetical protein